jgi:hypothetical protein
MLVGVVVAPGSTETLPTPLERNFLGSRYIVLVEDFKGTREVLLGENWWGDVTTDCDFLVVLEGGEVFDALDIGRALRHTLGNEGGRRLTSARQCSRGRGERFGSDVV